MKRELEEPIEQPDIDSNLIDVVEHECECKCGKKIIKQPQRSTFTGFDLKEYEEAKKALQELQSLPEPVPQPSTFTSLLQENSTWDATTSKSKVEKKKLLLLN